ncbi:hypothetical protein AAG570_005324 [Ranatra chinensis]|uniref:Uncharacterized protein n=1 Tax=Ranatra chinensis TaxID=642074 RepID=A0ABD0YNP6_9HEMI
MGDGELDGLHKAVGVQPRPLHQPETSPARIATGSDTGRDAGGSGEIHSAVGPEGFQFPVSGMRYGRSLAKENSVGKVGTADKAPNPPASRVRCTSTDDAHRHLILDC